MFRPRARWSAVHKKLSAKVTLWVLRGLGRGLRAAPDAISEALAWLLSECWEHCIPIRRDEARANVGRALGPGIGPGMQHEIVKRMFYGIALNYIKFLQIPFMSPRERVRLFKWTGLENLDRALERKKGVLILSAHLGAFDLLAVATAARGYPVLVISRTPRSKAIEAVWMSFRRAAGVLVVPEKNALRQILKGLREGSLVAMVLDQNMHRDRGVFVDFFGRPACTLDSLAVLALRTGAPVVPAFTWRRRQEGAKYPAKVDAKGEAAHEALFLPEVELTRSGDLKRDILFNTQRFTRIIEEQVRAHPDQWLWLHRRWKTRP